MTEPEQRLQSTAEFKQQLETVLVEEEKRAAVEQAAEAGRAVEEKRKVMAPLKSGVELKPPVNRGLRVAVSAVVVAGLAWGGWWIALRTAIEPKMVQIPAGCFQMGSPAEETGRDNDERQHQVCVKSFEIGQYEVTFEEYDRFCAATKREKPSDQGWGRGQRPVINVSWTDAVAYAEWLSWGRGQRPVINVSWTDAVAYAEWLSQQTGKQYRLPTEAEWEYTARAGTTTAYWWGNDIGRNRANCDGCGSQWDNQKTSPVGSFDPNPWKLYDTAGNVWEWTCSLYDENYGGAEQKCSNKDTIGPRSLRGGSWSYIPAWVRSAHRYGVDPSGRHFTIGFRLARSL